jgi:hypothetical protein
MVARAIVIAALLAAFFLHPANAQVFMCATGDIPAAFEKKHGETPRAHGLTNSGHMLLVLVNATTKSWTILMREPTPTESYCFLANGSGFRLVAPKLSNGEQIQWKPKQ